jgi:MoaA/NifB/PqqE/SkfB family radical SAM enzyme
MSENITDRIDSVTKIPVSHLAEAPPAPKSVKIELSGRCNYRCLRGDTPVTTIYGTFPIRELAETFDTVPVYTYKDGEVFIADAFNIQKTGADEELVRVAFDDGTHIDCTPDHYFLQFRTLGDQPGTEEWPTQAQDLKPGARIRAMRENIVGKGYVDICAGRHFRRKRSRLIMDYLMGRKLTRQEMVHHLDHDTSNDHPDNLQYVPNAKAHAAQHPEVAQRMRDNNPTKNMTPEWTAKTAAGNRGKTRTREQRLRYRASKLGRKNPNYKHGETAGRSRIDDVNHKVVSVTRLEERDDTYCMEVPATGWFFAGDVLVKNCGFCALRMRDCQPTADEDMDIELFQRITTEMREAGVEEIGVFFLGESFMNPGLLIDAIAWCKQDLKFPYVFLTSNASLSFPNRVEACMEAGLDSLKWSVNAATPEQFQEVMGVKPQLYERAFEHIREAWELREMFGYKTKLYASSIRFDGEQQEKMEKLLEERVYPYVDQHYWLPLYSMGSFATQREAELGYRPTAGNQGRLGALREPLPCWSAFTEGHVRADGGLSACCFDAGGQWLMGDLKEQSFMDAWQSEKFQTLRKAHIAKDVTGTICENCVAYGGE